MATPSQPKISDEAVKAATGKTWAEWVALLDSAGARNMPHKEIAQWLYDSGHLTLPWWGQMVTVGYEQRIGRREAGQRCDGEFTAGASKTLSGTLDSVLETWQARVKGVGDFNGVPLEGPPRVSSSDKWRYWRVNLADGTQVSVNIGLKSEGKIGLAVDHAKLADKDAADSWKAFWKSFLAGL